jgi:hypothetical protein
MATTMSLHDYLSAKGKPPQGKTKDWLSFCTLTIKSGALWAGDPHLANADDGCIVKVPEGKYVVEGIGLGIERNRIVSKLRVRLEGTENLKAGKAVGETGTDSAMIGVCEIDAFEAAYKKKGGAEKIQQAIVSQTRKGFGFLTVSAFPDTMMPFVPIGSDGSGPVFGLMSKGKCVGIELPFMD